MLQEKPYWESTPSTAQSNSRSLQDYYSAPKYFGELSPDKLIDIISHAAESAETIESNHAAMAYRDVIASGLIEHSLTCDSIASSVDERVNDLKLAVSLFRNAADSRYRELQTGYRNPDDQIEWQRAELQHDFAASHVYSDLIAGEVTSETRDETLAVLGQRLNYVRGLYRTDYATAARGLECELITLIDWWKKLDLVHAKVAIPATLRGGSGRFIPTDTHDVAVACFDPGKDTELLWEYYEVKSENALKKVHFDRYASHLTVVGNDNSVHHILNQGRFASNPRNSILTTDAEYPTFFNNLGDRVARTQ